MGKECAKGAEECLPVRVRFCCLQGPLLRSPRENLLGNLMDLKMSYLLHM